MKTGKIVAINGNGTWKDLFKFEYEMECSDENLGKVIETSSCLHKTKDSPYHVGQIIDYEITVNDKGFSNIKFQGDKPAFSGKSNFTPKDPVEEAKRQLSINRQTSLKCSTELVCAGKIQFDDILLWAKKLTDWTVGDAEASKMYGPDDKLPF